MTGPDRSRQPVAGPPLQRRPPPGYVPAYGRAPRSRATSTGRPHRHAPRRQGPGLRTTVITTAVVATIAFGAWIVVLRDTGPSGPFLTASTRATTAARSVLDGVDRVGVTGDLEKLTGIVDNAAVTMRRQADVFEQAERENDGAAAAIAADAQEAADRSIAAFEIIVGSLLTRGQVTDVDIALEDLGAAIVVFDDAAARWKNL